MHEIHLSRAAVVASDRPWSGFQAVGSSEHIANNSDRFETFDRQSDDWGGSDEVFEILVKWLRNMLGVVFTRQFWCDLQHLHCDNVEPLSLKTANDFTDQATLNTVRFQQYEGCFHDFF